MKDLSVLLDMIQGQLAGIQNVIKASKINPENYDQSYLKGYEDATLEIVTLVEKINGHLQKGGK
jgi:glycogen synthase